MTASVTLIVIGVFLLIGGDWPAAYGIACIVSGAIAWHKLEHARRSRPAPTQTGLAGVRKALTIAAGLCEVMAVLVAGGFAFEHPQSGLFNGFALDAVLGAFGFGAGLLFAAAQLNALSARLPEDVLAWLTPSRGSP